MLDLCLLITVVLLLFCLFFFYMFRRYRDYLSQQRLLFKRRESTGGYLPEGYYSKARTRGSYTSYRRTYEKKMAEKKAVEEFQLTPSNEGVIEKMCPYCAAEITDIDVICPYCKRMIMKE